MMVCLLSEKGRKRMSLPVMIIGIIGIILLLISLVKKIRWLTLVSIFLFLIVAWLIIGEMLTGVSF